MIPDRALTILLTLKGRPAFTLRWLSYANRLQFPFNVLIADGSAAADALPALSSRAMFPHVRYDYVRYPYDATYSEYYAKIADALRRIQTPLVALADNDDVFVLEGLRQAAQFLMDHSDYATCGGQC